MSKRRQKNKRAKQVKAQKATNKPKGGFTIKADDVEKHVLEKAGENAPAIERVVAAGMKLLFSKESHNKIFDEIRPQDQVPLEDEIGAGAVQVMKILISESKGTMPGEAVIPAGTILIAKTCEFIHKSKMANVKNSDFTGAVEMMNAVLQRDAKAEIDAQKGGGTQLSSPQAAPEKPMPPQAGGMLQAGG